MSQKITYDKANGGSGTITLEQTEYLSVSSEWKMDETDFRAVFSGKYKRKQRGYYLTVTISYDSVKNSTFFALKDIFTVGTKNIKYFPDSASSECYEMDLPESLTATDFLETYQDGIDVVLRSVYRYENPIPNDIGYWGCRKIDFTYPILFDGTEV